MILKGIRPSIRPLYLLLGLLALLQSCGISSTAYYLEPPDINVSDAQISVWNTSSNYIPSEGSNQTFKGIEIYYRVFQVRLEAESAFASLTSYVSQYQYPFSPGNYPGFSRMRREDINTPPLISIDANNTRHYTISLSSWDLLDDATNVQSKVVRNITSDTGGRLPFQERNFQSSDADYQGDTSVGGGPYYIVAFAVSFGKDTTDTSIGAPIYSVPSFHKIIEF